MRLFFEDPSGERLALDTRAKEWAATYENDATQISNDHFIIAVESADVLRRIEREADFCGFGYNNEIDDERRTPQASLYAEYLQELAAFTIEVEAAGEIENGPSVEYLTERKNNFAERIEHANGNGYFNPVQYATLILVLDDITKSVELYEQALGIYQEATQGQEDPEPEPF